MTTPSNICVLGSVSVGWLNAQGGFVFDKTFYLDPANRKEREGRVHAFLADRFPDDPVYHLEAHLVQVEGRQKPVVLVGGLQPNLILGAALGAKLVFPGDKDPDITPAPLADLKDLRKLTSIDWPATWPISLFLDQIDAMRSRFGDSATVIPPFFWDTTGRAAIHGPLTTAQKLLGERIFLDMTDKPGFTQEVLDWIADTYASLIRLFSQAAGLKVTGLHVGECSACMLGPEPFHNFVVPALNRLSEKVGPLRLHSCGKSDHLLDVFREVAKVASLNLGGGTSLSAARKRFPSVPIDLAPPLFLLDAATPPDQVDRWIRQAVGDNGDAPLEIQYHLDLGQSEANCLQIHATLRDLGAAVTRRPVN